MGTEPTAPYQLRQDFRYFHEPVPEELSPSWVVGRAAVAQELADRIMFSRGGAFLVSGLRGVGKTSCVRLAISLIRADPQRFARQGADFELVDVWINLARPIEPVQLLHHLIRHLYLRLKEMRLLNELDPRLQGDLRTAFMRTSFEISYRSLVAASREVGAELSVGKLPWLGLEVLGKLSRKQQDSRSEEEALKYLPYDEKAAEFELLSFCARLLRRQPVESAWLQRLWRRLTGTLSSDRRFKIVFVLDELDKLENTSDKSTKSALDPILETLKTVFSASESAFIFIAGKEVEEKLLDDTSQGNSIYESIFAYDTYLPCLWEEQSEILNRCFDLQSKISEKNDTVALYLRYKGRGVPRRTWRELNKQVLWRSEGPVLEIGLERRRYMRVFAKLQEALETETESRAAFRWLDDAQFDRRRLCFYYSLDWIFSRGRESFSVHELEGVVAALNLGRANKETSPFLIAKKIVKLLVSRAFIERADRELTKLNKNDEEAFYRLAPWILLIFENSPDEPPISDLWDQVPEGSRKENPVRTEVDQYVERYFGKPPAPFDTAIKPARRRGVSEHIGRYKVVKMLGRGGFASVYEVRDWEGRKFAAKLLLPEIAALPEGLALFGNEVEVLRNLSHPGIPRLYDSGSEDGQVFLITDLLQGLNLRQVLDILKKVEIGDACVITRRLTEIVGYIHTKRIVRLDIKPANIFFTDDGEIKVVDFGIIRFINDDNGFDSKDEGLVGTPLYMAPEQLAGRCDARSDVFALGAVLYEMLTGQRFLQFDSRDTEWDKRPYQAGPPISQLVQIPAELDSAVSKALTTNPNDRFQTMHEFGVAIAPFVRGDARDIVQRLMVSQKGSAVLRDEKTDVFPKLREPARGSDWGPQLPVDAAPDEEGMSDEHKAVGDAARLSRLLYDPDPSVRAAAFHEMCSLSKRTNGPLHLLFDLQQRICLWSPDGQLVLTFRLLYEGLRMGRDSAEVEMPLPDTSVSRQHVAFFPSRDSIEVEDLSSASGTFLNGKRCRRERLSDGDSLRIGLREISIHIPNLVNASSDNGSAPGSDAEPGLARQLGVNP